VTSDSNCGESCSGSGSCSIVVEVAVEVAVAVSPSGRQFVSIIKEKGVGK